MDSGLIGDYHKLMKSADVISNNMNPRTTYNGNADMTDVVSTIHDMQVQWLVAADRDTNNYQPETSIPIGEMQYDKRMVNVWASSHSRIIAQYITLLRGYNLYPKESTLIDLLKQFGHIASNGLISIPCLPLRGIRDSTRILWSLRLMMIKRDSGSQTADTEMSVRILLDFITRKKRMLSISNLLR